MSRDLKTILDSIITEKETRSTLDGLTPLNTDAQEFLDRLNSTSKVARWLNFFYFMAFAIKIHEDIFDLHKAEVEATADLLIVGTARWLQTKALEYQDGDALQFNAANGTYGYATVVDSTDAKRVVQRAAVREEGGIVIFKIANASGSTITPLTVAEKTGFNRYIKKVSPAGTQMSIISDSADVLHVELTVKYSPLVLTSAGELKTDNSIKPVEVAINNYISNLDFNGVFNLTQLIDAVQLASGVDDAYITLAEARAASAATFTDVVPTNEYVTNAGYLEIDAGNPLSGAITYTAS